MNNSRPPKLLIDVVHDKFPLVKIGRASNVRMFCRDVAQLARRKPGRPRGKKK